MPQLSARLPVLLAGLALSSCAVPPALQDNAPVDLQDPPPSEEEPRARLGLALSTDAAWLTTGARLRQSGWMTFELFGSDDDDYAGNVTLLRMGRASTELPLHLGVGISFYGYKVELDDDATGGALALRGLAAYELSTAFPSRVAAELTLAPDVSSFGEGEGLLDGSVRFEFDVSTFATAFLGYRRLEIDVEDDSDQTLEEGIHFGVLIGY
ncbi:MAG: hypothetical protein GY711_12825 [bacterium]|nr:hypothetical protein [bacterium]